jgi:hypothetical protein
VPKCLNYQYLFYIHRQLFLSIYQHPCIDWITRYYPRDTYSWYGLTILNLSLKSFSLNRNLMAQGLCMKSSQYIHNGLSCTTNWETVLLPNKTCMSSREYGSL